MDWTGFCAGIAYLLFFYLLMRGLGRPRYGGVVGDATGASCRVLL